MVAAPDLERHDERGEADGERQEEEEGAADRRGSVTAWAKKSGLSMVELLGVDPQHGHEQRGGAGQHEVEQRGDEPDPPDDLVVAGAEDRRQARRGRGGGRGL